MRAGAAIACVACLLLAACSTTTGASPEFAVDAPVEVADVATDAVPADDGSAPDDGVAPDGTTAGDLLADPPADPAPDGLDAEFLPPDDTAPDTDACAPLCGGRTCGDDGCGGTCGSCTGGLVCDASGQCGPCHLPASWGPLAVVDTLAVPAEAAAIAASCFDLTGDGVPDNGLASFATLLNATLASGLAGGRFAPAFEFGGGGDLKDVAKFPLAVLGGRPDPLDAHGYLVDPAAYDPATCAPRLYDDPAAALAAGVLSSAHGPWQLQLPWQGLLLRWNVRQARVRGTVTASAPGAWIADGVLGGVVTYDDLLAGLADLEAQCTVASPSPFCQFLPQLKQVLPSIPRDVDTDGDGVPDAVSACARFTARPGAATGSACVPDCTGKACGADGCGGDCGGCPDGQACGPAATCVTPTCSLPQAWGPVARVATMVVPKDAAVIAAKCPDRTGDGAGDDALAAFADVLNPLLKQELDKGWYGAVAEFVGVTDFLGAPPFPLNVLAAGTDVYAGTDRWVRPASYDPATCAPRIRFDGATLAAGVLAAGPASFQGTVAFPGLAVPAAVQDVVVSGRVTVVPAGLAVTDGVLAGVVTRASILAMVPALQAACGVLPAPAWCPQLAALTLVPAAFDLDLDGDGIKDAASLCVQFTMAPVAILGLSPAP